MQPCSQDAFTPSWCCCRRCIQRIDQPIILTGYAALNKLLGRQVYSSQLQLGGPKVCLIDPVLKCHAAACVWPSSRIQFLCIHHSHAVTATQAHDGMCLLQVMGVNGVSHSIVRDDLEGATSILLWISTMPPVIGMPPCLLQSSDPVDRPIGYCPAPGEPALTLSLHLLKATTLTLQSVTVIAGCNNT